MVDAHEAHREADPQAKSIVRIFGGTEDGVRTVLHGLIALLLEVGSGMGLYVVFGSHRAPRTDDDGVTVPLAELAWFERLISHADTLRKARVPVVLAGDFNVVPTDLDIYSTTSYDDNALLQPTPRAAWRRLLKQGWT